MGLSFLTRTALVSLTALAFSITAGAAIRAKETPEQTLTVYTYDAFAAEWGPGPKIEAGFEKICDCDLEFVALDSSVGIFNRLKLEGASTTADIVLGLDTNLTAEARASGLLTPHGADTSRVTLPTGAWTDDTFVPFDYGYFAFVYNSEKIKDVPTSLDALVNADKSLKIVLQDPRSSTPGLGFMLWMKAVYGEESDAAWGKLSNKIVSVTKSWSDAYFNLFLAGEADMVLSYTTSPAYHAIVENDPKFKAAAFSEGHYIQIEVAAAVKSGDTPELAAKFMQYITDDAFQSQIPTGNWMYPVTDVKQPDGFAALVKPARTLMFTDTEVAANRKAWTGQWLDALDQ